MTVNEIFFCLGSVTYIWKDYIFCYGLHNFALNDTKISVFLFKCAMMLVKNEKAESSKTVLIFSDESVCCHLALEPACVKLAAHFGFCSF